MRLMEFSFLNIKELFALIFSIIALIFYTPVQEIAFENSQGNWNISTNSKIIIYSLQAVVADLGHFYKRLHSDHSWLKFLKKKTFVGWFHSGI